MKQNAIGWKLTNLFEIWYSVLRKCSARGRNIQNPWNHFESVRFKTCPRAGTTTIQAESVDISTVENGLKNGNHQVKIGVIEHYLLN